MPYVALARIGIALAASFVLGKVLGKRPERVASQRDPNEVVTSGTPTSPTQFIFGERRVAGVQVYAGVETYQVTDRFSRAAPGTGRRLHLAYALCEGECEGPTGIRIGEDLITLAQGVKAVGKGLTVAPDTTTDGGMRWQMRTSAGGTATAIWFLKADGTQGASMRAAADRIGTRGLPFSDDHRGTGIAWVHIALDQPPLNPSDANAKFVWPNTIPAFEFFLKGLKLRRVDTGDVEWTANAADVRFWVETQFLGFPADRIDSKQAALARSSCARMINLDKSKALGLVRFCYRLTAANTEPDPPSGASFPPGGNDWGIRVPAVTETMPFLWVAVQVYDTSTSAWGAWGSVKLLRRWGRSAPGGRPGGAGDDGRIVMKSSLTATADGYDKTLDPDAVDVRGGPQGAPSATITVGVPTGSILSGTSQSVAWVFGPGARPQLPASLAAGDAPVEVRSLTIRPNNAGTVCNLTFDVSADLSETWERADNAIRIKRISDGATFLFDGPNRDSQRKRDATSPYAWKARESWPEFRNWIGNSGDSGFALTFSADDGDDAEDGETELPPGVQPGETDSPYLPLFNADRIFEVYAVNGVVSGDDFDRAQALRDELDIAWAGRAVYDGGQLFFHPGTDDTIQSAFKPTTGETLAVRTSQSVFSKPNALTTSLAESRVHAFEPWTMRALVDEAALERDGRRILQDIGVRGFVTSPAQAEVLMAMQLRQLRGQRVVARKEEWSMDVIRLRPGARVTLLDPENGFTTLSPGSPIAHQGNVSGRFMQIISRQLNPSDLTVEFTLVEHFDGTFVPDAFRFPQLEPDVTSPGGWVPQPSGLKLRSAADDGFDAASSLRIEAEWNPSVAARTLVQWRPVVPANGSLKIINSDGSFTTLSSTPDWGRPREMSVEGNGASITGVRHGVRYQVRIKHVSSIGIESTWSSVAAITVGALDGRAQPRNVRLSAQTTSGVVLQWELPPLSRPPLWMIQTRIPSSTIVGADSWQTPAFVDGGETRWTGPQNRAELEAILTLYGGQGAPTIEARILPAQTYDDSTQAGGAVVVSDTLTTGGALPAAPVVNVQNGSGFVTLLWTPVPGAVRYRVERANGATGSASDFALLATSTAAAGYTDRTAVNGQSYRYRVRAEASDTVFSAWSAVVVGAPRATITVTSGPDSPTNVRVTADTNSATVTWTPGAWGTGSDASRRFRIRWRAGTSGVERLVTPSPATSTSATISGLASDTAYQVRVEVFTDNGSDQSAWVSFRTDEETVAPPSAAWGSWSNSANANSFPWSGAIGRVSIGSAAAEEDNNVWIWDPSSVGYFQPTDLPAGLTTSGVMGTKTQLISGARVVIQVFQSYSSNANRMRRTDTNALVTTDLSWLFQGDLDTRRSGSFNFTDAFLVSAISNGPTGLFSPIRPIGFLRWSRTIRDSAVLTTGVGRQDLLIINGGRFWHYWRDYS